VPEGPDEPEKTNLEVNTAARTDLAFEVDWIRFQRPKVRSEADWYAQVSGGVLADPNLSEADLLKALGD
jgi:hypothetical protein